MRQIIKLGTRGSALAMAQANYTRELLANANPGLTVEIIVIETRGDRDTKNPLEKIGGIGLFTKKIEKALIDGAIDIAVHSAKDLPARMTEGLRIAAVPPREKPEDAWLAKEGNTLEQTPAGSIVGTSSPRRRAQLLYMRPDLRVADIRGNVPTRLKKMQDGVYHALIMARAGLTRLGLTQHISENLPPETFVPAPGQGFLAIQVRTGDERTALFANKIDNQKAHLCLDIERLYLQRLDSGCSMAVGGWGRFQGDKMCFNAVVLDSYGKKRVEVFHEINANAPIKELIDPVVEQLFAQGAKELMGNSDE